MPHFTHRDLSEALPAVEAVAIGTGKIQLRDYDNHECEITIKDDGSPVLLTDLECSAFLEKQLSAIFPGLPMVSEENDIPAPASGTYVAFDPLDGTVEFIDDLKRGDQIKNRFDGQRLGGFAVKIVVFENHKPALAVIHAPVQGMTYSSTLDDFAWRVLPSGLRTIMGVRMMKSDPDHPRILKALFNGKSNPLDLYKTLRQEFAQRSVFLSRTPSAKPGLPRNMRVVDGQADLHIARNGYAWDNAPDQLIVRNAGCDMFSMTTGKDLVFENPRILSGPYIVTSDMTLRTKLFPGARPS